MLIQNGHTTAHQLININNGTVTNVELKILPSFNVQQGDKQESNQTLIQKKDKIDRNLKPHRNCPKKMSDDFLWN